MPNSFHSIQSKEVPLKLIQLKDLALVLKFVAMKKRQGTKEDKHSTIMQALQLFQLAKKYKQHDKENQLAVLYNRSCCQ